MASKPLAPISSDTRELLLIAIQRSEQPQTAKQLAAYLPRSCQAKEKQLTPVLDELVAGGTLHSFSLPRKQTGYWDRDIVEFGRMQIVRMLDEKGPLPKTEIKKAAKGLSDKHFQQALDGLIASNQLREHPLLPKARSPRFGRKPPPPEAYLEDVGKQLKKIVGQLKAAGVTADTLATATRSLLEQVGLPLAPNETSGDQDESGCSSTVDIIALMRNIEPKAEGGALVTFHKLRREACVDKRSFDHAVLDLACQRRLLLFPNNDVMSLTQADRDELVTDGNGTYYVGVALPRSTECDAPTDQTVFRSQISRAS